MAAPSKRVEPSIVAVYFVHGVTIRLQGSMWSKQSIDLRNPEYTGWALAEDDGWLLITTPDGAEHKVPAGNIRNVSLG